MNAPEKLFEGGPEWGPGLGLLQWTNKETGEFGEGEVWTVYINPLICELEIIPSNVHARIRDHGVFDSPSLEDALTWLRTRIIAHRDELNRITGHAPPPSDLTRAQELLKSRREAAGTRPSARIEWDAESGLWTVWVSWADTRHTRTGYPGVDLSPLAAVRAAIAMTPWSGVENK